MDIDLRESKLQERLEQLKVLETEVHKREKALKVKESSRKQVLLRLAPSLWDKIAAWADEDFRSINGQIEFLLSEAVKKHYKETEE
jgi:hypothetical protein